MKMGSRGSRLALIQTEIALRSLGIEAEVEVVNTSGDASSKRLKDLGGRAFTRELDDALLSGRVDLAVHSLKDVPVEDFPEGIEIACVVERGDPRDCLVSEKGVLSELPSGAVVGTCSERRKAELLRLREDLDVRPLRGNVPTRLGKLDGGEYDAIVTAKCALDRLGLSGRATQVFEVDEMVPAAGQGAIAVVTRKGETLDAPGHLTGFLQPCLLEREFIKGLGACRNPVGACCGMKQGGFNLQGLVYHDSDRFSPVFNGPYDNIIKAMREWRGEVL